MLMSPGVERSMSLRVERYEISLTIRSNAVSSVHSASCLGKYRLHDREQLEACTEKRPIEAALPTVIIFASLYLFWKESFS